MVPAEKHQRSQNEFYDLAKQFFGFGDNPEKIKIILPSVPRKRKIKFRCLNYPLYDYDVSPDDVHSAMRIYSLLTAIYGAKIAEVYSQNDFRTKPNGNLILIGGSPTNIFTFSAIKDCPICFGRDKVNRVIRLYKKDYKKIELSDNKITKDYCLISKRSNNHNIEFVVAGLRAYGQEGVYHFLSQERFYRQVQDVSQADNFQIVVEIEVEGTSCVDWMVVKKLPWTPSPAGSKSVEDEIATILQSASWQSPNLLYIEDFSVVGDYVRHDRQTRNLLQDFCRRITAAMREKTNTWENYVFGGPSSAGKTYLVEETARMIKAGQEIFYHRLNLADMTEHAFSTELELVRNKVNEGHRVLCLLDEIDTKTKCTWLFEKLRPHLDLNLESKAPVVWVLVGSTRRGPQRLMPKLDSRRRADDVDSRIPPDNYLFIPMPEPADRLLICLSEIDKCARAINSVEKFALFYLSTSGQLRKSKHLKHFVQKAVERVETGGNQLNYDHLFGPNDERGKKFRDRHRERRSSLIGDYLQFARKRGT